MLRLAAVLVMSLLEFGLLGDCCIPCILVVYFRWDVALLYCGTVSSALLASDYFY